MEIHGGGPAKDSAFGSPPPNTEGFPELPVENRTHLPSPPSPEFIFFVALTYNQPTCLPLISFYLLNPVLFLYLFCIFCLPTPEDSPFPGTGAGTRSPFVR